MRPLKAAIFTGPVTICRTAFRSSRTLSPSGSAAGGGAVAGAGLAGVGTAGAGAVAGAGLAGVGTAEAGAVVAPPCFGLGLTGRRIAELPVPSEVTSSGTKWSSTFNVVQLFGAPQLCCAPQLV